MAPAKHVRSHSRRARAVLELCHGNQCLSAPFWAMRRPRRPNTTLLTRKGLAVVLNLISSGRIWYLHVEWGLYNWSSESVAFLLRIMSFSP